MNIRDTLERLVWTFVAAAGGNLIGGAFFDVDVIQAAAMAGIAAAVNFITLLARQRLSVLPDPGDGLPALPVEGDAGISERLVLILILLAILIWAVATGHLAFNVD